MAVVAMDAVSAGVEVEVNPLPEVAPVAVPEWSPVVVAMEAPVVAPSAVERGVTAAKATLLCSPVEVVAVALSASLPLVSVAAVSAGSVSVLLPPPVVPLLVPSEPVSAAAVVDAAVSLLSDSTAEPVLAAVPAVFCSSDAVSVVDPVVDVADSVGDAEVAPAPAPVLVAAAPVSVSVRVPDSSVVLGAEPVKTRVRRPEVVAEPVSTAVVVAESSAFDPVVAGSPDAVIPGCWSEGVMVPGARVSVTLPEVAPVAPVVMPPVGMRTVDSDSDVLVALSCVIEPSVVVPLPPAVASVVPVSPELAVETSVVVSVPMSVPGLVSVAGTSGGAVADPVADPVAVVTGPPVPDSVAGATGSPVPDSVAVVTTPPVVVSDNVGVTNTSVPDSVAVAVVTTPAPDDTTTAPPVVVAADPSDIGSPAAVLSTPPPVVLSSPQMMPTPQRQTGSPMPPHGEPSALVDVACVPSVGWTTAGFGVATCGAPESEREPEEAVGETAGETVGETAGETVCETTGETPMPPDVDVTPLPGEVVWSLSPPKGGIQMGKMQGMGQMGRPGTPHIGGGGTMQAGGTQGTGQTGNPGIPQLGGGMTQAGGMYDEGHAGRSPVPQVGGREDWYGGDAVVIVAG